MFEHHPILNYIDFNLLLGIFLARVAGTNQIHRTPAFTDIHFTRPLVYDGFIQLLPAVRQAFVCIIMVFFVSWSSVRCCCVNWWFRSFVDLKCAILVIQIRLLLQHVRCLIWRSLPCWINHAGVRLDGFQKVHHLVRGSLIGRIRLISLAIRTNGYIHITSDLLGVLLLFVYDAAWFGIDLVVHGNGGCDVASASPRGH